MKITILDSKATHKNNHQCPANRFVFAGSTIQCVDCGLHLVHTITEVEAMFTDCNCDGGVLHEHGPDGRVLSKMECWVCAGTGKVSV